MLFFLGDKILCLVTSCSKLFWSKKISWNLLPVIVNQIPPCLAKKSPHNRWSLIQFGGKRFFYREPMRHLLHSTNCCHLNVNTWLLKVIVQHKVCLSFFLSFTDLPLAPLFKFNLPLNLDIAMFHWSWKSQLTQTFNLMQILYQGRSPQICTVYLCVTLKNKIINPCSKTNSLITRLVYVPTATKTILGHLPDLL